MTDRPDSARTSLPPLRSNPARRWGFTIAGSVIGLVLVWLHWIGLVVGAALVALPRRSLTRGILAGVGFGILATVANIATLGTASGAALTTYLGMGQILLLSLVIPLVAGGVGGLFRGLVG